MSDTNKQTVAVRIAPETKKQIEDNLEYGDSMSAWFRDAAAKKLLIDEKESEHADELPEGWLDDALDAFFSDQEAGDEGNFKAAALN